MNVHNSANYRDFPQPIRRISTEKGAFCHLAVMSASRTIIRILSERIEDDELIHIVGFPSQRKEIGNEERALQSHSSWPWIGCKTHTPGP